MNRVVLHTVLLMCLSVIVYAQTELHDLAQNPSEQPVKVFTVLDDEDGIHEGDEFSWDVVVRWNHDEVEIRPEVVNAPIVKNLELINTSTSFRSGSNADGIYSETVFHYVLRALEEGEASIGAVDVSCQKPDETFFLLKTDRVKVTVLPERYSFLQFVVAAWSLIWVKIALTALIVTVICVTCFLALRTPKGAEPAEDEDSSDPVEEALILAKTKRVEGDHKHYFIKLEEAVRLRLIEAHPGVSSTNLRDYGDAVSPDKKVVFDRFLQECEEAKYAPVSPSADVLDRAWDDVERIVNES